MKPRFRFPELSVSTHNSFYADPDPIFNANAEADPDSVV
jgi:hypothetical protein